MGSTNVRSMFVFSCKLRCSVPLVVAYHVGEFGRMRIGQHSNTTTTTTTTTTRSHENRRDCLLDLGNPSLALSANILPPTPSPTPVLWTARDRLGRSRGHAACDVGVSPEEIGRPKRRPQINQAQGGLVLWYFPGAHKGAGSRIRRNGTRGFHTPSKGLPKYRARARGLGPSL